MRLLACLLLIAVVGLACAGPTPIPSPTATATAPLPSPTATPTSTAVPTPTATFTPTATPTPTTTPTATPVPFPPLGAIPDAPDRDLFDLARRLAPERSGGTPTPEPGVPRRQFWVVDVGAVGVYQVPATLQYVSRRAYWYVEDARVVPSKTLEDAARRFDEEVYPQVIAVFGSKTRAGFDGAPITILLSRLNGAAGFNSSADRYPTWVYPYSNGQPTLYVDHQVAPVGSNAFFGVLAHEFQHLVHGDEDPSEDTWINEGLSELASALAGFTSPRLASLFLESPRSLVLWPESAGATAPYYGGAYLFVSYLYTHYGGADGIRALVQRPENGIRGVDAYLAERGYGKTFRDVFADWTVANYLDAPSGPYSYAALTSPAPPGRVVREFGAVTGDIPQYAAEYVALRLPQGDAEVTFSGTAALPLLPVAPYSGQACWWGNRGDSMDSTLTRSVDLSGLQRATLSFRLWYGIERHWDYAYVEVSTDGGTTWNILAGPTSSTENPVANAFGPGYTGTSADWVNEAIDLTPYAGRKVLLRFEYVTDDSVNGDGVCIDDISIPEAGFFDDAETGGDWAAQGFLRVGGSGVVQRYAVRVIERLKDGGFSVLPVALDSQNQGRTVIRGFGTQLNEATVMIAALAPKTAQTAAYSLQVQPAP
ncbi:MAG: immune inhibitor A [Chloroflexi bacterium]|nr:immune inhibitor A [Chloroflexota bacterium]